MLFDAGFLAPERVGHFLRFRHYPLAERDLLDHHRAFWTKTSSSMVGIRNVSPGFMVPKLVEQLLDQRIGLRLPGTIKGHALNRVTLDD